jgi:protein-L-isoaspartate(D-aspartate) O-methyltransferase
MLELRAGACSKVLEITGCGPDRRARADHGQVYTVGASGLLAKARRHLQGLKVKNVRLMHGDGTADLGEDLDFDAILVAAGATHVPTRLLKYLKPGGRIVLPLTHHDEGGESIQRLTVIEATPSGYREQAFDAVRFVPLLPGLA